MYSRTKCAQWTKPKENTFPKLRGHPNISTLKNKKNVCMKKKWQGNAGEEKVHMKTKTH
jgi:hypothetical protein